MPPAHHVSQVGAYNFAKHPTRQAQNDISLNEEKTVSWASDLSCLAVSSDAGETASKPGRRGLDAICWKQPTESFSICRQRLTKCSWIGSFHLCPSSWPQDYIGREQLLNFANHSAELLIRRRAKDWATRNGVVFSIKDGGLTQNKREGIAD